MSLYRHRHVVVLLLLGAFLSTPGPRAAARPLTDKELLALVAGNVLTENVVHEVESRGLAFEITESYGALLATAGADSTLLEAVRKASAVAQPARSASNAALLSHLAQAGKLIRSKQFGEATQELESALDSDSGPETGFVIGELYRRQEQWSRSIAVYQQVLQLDPDFPDAHTKLAYVFYRAGDQLEYAAREAKAALAITPNNAEAHKNWGLVLGMLGKYEAAFAEFQEALRLKPDYEAVYYNVGLFRNERNQPAEAAAAFRKAIALNPDNPDSRYHLSHTLNALMDKDGAIREYREVKRLAPKRVDARQNLAAILLDRDLDAAIVEFRELVQLAPNFSLARLGLGLGLFRKGNYEEALKEFQIGAELDPTEADGAAKVGLALEHLGRLEEATAAFQHALRLDGTWYRAYEGLGRVHMAQKQYAQAVDDFRRASALQPAIGPIHGYYAEALAAAGRTQEAISEYRQSLLLQSTQVAVRLRFAALLEKLSDWPEALEQYRQAARDDSDRNAQKDYNAAQERLKVHLATLRASGKAYVAEDIESKFRAIDAEPTLSEQLDAAMEAAERAMGERQLDTAERAYKKALQLAESLQPHDQRLVTVLGRLGMLYIGRNGRPSAEEYLLRQLGASEEIFGPQSPMNSEPLERLGQAAMLRNDFVSARGYFQRALDLNLQAYGENSRGASRGLAMMALFHYVQKDYSAAEPYLLHAVKVDETLYGADGLEALMNLTPLCTLYDKWEKPDKSEPCNARMLVILEKQYGTSSPVLTSVLTNQARALRSLGRIEDADRVEKRAREILQAQNK